MMAIVLAGGYAKRLLPLTLDTPKPLLPIAGRPLIEYSLDLLSSLGSTISTVIVLTNRRFEAQFTSWARAKTRQDLRILSDGSSSEEDKPGAVAALASLARDIDDDFLVIASDCIYEEGLTGLLQFFSEKKAPIVGIYRAKELDQVERGSAVELGAGNAIVNFVEKPVSPKTDLVGAVIYAFPQGIKNRLIEYCTSGLSPDEPGRFIEWLHKKEKIYGYLMGGTVWDVGTLRAYHEVDRAFSENPVS